MKHPRLLSGLVWLCSLGAVYWAGASMAPWFHSAQGQTASTSGAAPRRVDGAAGEKSGPPPSVAELIARTDHLLSQTPAGPLDRLRAVLPLGELQGSQIKEALAEVERTIPDQQKRTTIDALLLGKLAEADATAALAYADQKFGRHLENEGGVRYAILSQWARRDPDAAWQWLETRRRARDLPGIPDSWTSTILQASAGVDLKKAIERALTLETGRATALANIAGGVTDEAERLQLLERARTMAPAERRAIDSRAILGWMEFDGKAALQWIERQPPPERKEFTSIAAESLLSTEPRRAADLLLEEAAPEEKPKIYGRIARSWAFRDPQTAAAWLAALPQGPDLDEARSQYAQGAVAQDPAAAMRSAISVPSESRRAIAVEQVYRQWVKKDAAAAEAALRASGLPEARIQSIQNSGVKKPNRIP